MVSFLPNRMQLHWPEVQVFLRKEWPRLTDVDLDEIDGEYDRLIAKVNELYDGPIPITQEASIKGKIQRFLNTLEDVSLS